MRFTTAAAVCAVLAFESICAASSAAQSQRLLPTVEDAVGMTRIQFESTESGQVAAISPNGRFAAIVTWRGDLQANTNVYDLLLVDLLDKTQPGVLGTLRFPGDPYRQDGTAISHVTFVGDGQVAFLGREGTSPSQVYLVDIRTRDLRRVTNHPLPVASFVIDGNGKLRVFSAMGQIDIAAFEERRQQDGVFLDDTSVFPFAQPGFTANPALVWPTAHAHREYFLSGRGTPIFDSRSSRPTPDDTDPKGGLTLEHDLSLQNLSRVTANPSGTHALFYPFARTAHPMRSDRYAYFKDRTRSVRHMTGAPYGLLDMRTGKIELLIDAPSPWPYERRTGGPAFWSPDGRSVVLYTLDPNNPNQAPRWVEFDVGSRRTTPMSVPEGWSALGFVEGGDAILLRRGDEVGLMRRNAESQWADIRILGGIDGFNAWWPPAINDRALVGVSDGFTTAPELTVWSHQGRERRTLTNLNPWLKDRQLGEIEDLTLSADGQRYSAGYLIKPIGFVAGRKYPLVLLLDDGFLSRQQEPFLFDGAFWNLSGHAAQMLAVQGFMVFYVRAEHAVRGMIERPEEAPKITRHVEAIVAELDRRGLIDTRRMGLSGFSRAAWWTKAVLMRSRMHFAAASAIDGGGREYNEEARPFTDAELERISVPLLYEAHDIRSLVEWGNMADRMYAKGHATETLYFETAPHATVRPQHRLRSLQTHIDWWRFWLMGENPVGLNADRGPRWHELKKKLCSRLKGAGAPWYCH